MPIALVDDFNRANGGPGSAWSGPAISTYNVPNIVSNQLDWPSFPSLYYNTSYAEDQGCEVQMTGASEQVYLVLRLTSPNSGSERCYWVSCAWGGLGPAEAFKLTSGVASQSSLGFANGIFLSTDKWVRATAEGSSTTTLKAYGSSDGNTWNLRQTWTDSTSAITGAGFTGLHHPNNVAPGTLDNYGAGALAAALPERQSFYVTRRRMVRR